MSVRKSLYLLLVTGTFVSCLCQTLKRSEILDINGRFLAEWEVDFDTEIIVFTLDVETTGYVALGIAPGPNMVGSDIVIGGVRDDGTTYFADYYAPSNVSPRLDASQDWELLSANETNGHTTLQFSRKLDTCDEAQDVAITNDTQYLIWAIGDTDAITYHGLDPNKRDSKIINLLDAPSPDADLTQYETFQIRREQELLAVDTSYWCTIHKAPNFNGIKRHIVAFNTTLSSERSIRHTHDLVLYKCEPPIGQSPEYFEQFLDHPGGECFDENLVIPVQYCKSVIYIWSVGGEMLVLPEKAGYPIGDTDRQEYYVLEIHVDNPELETARYEVGIDVFYTSNLREFDAAVFGIAHDVNHLQIIPPRTDSFVNIGHCSSECTSATIPEAGMTLINVMFHAHKAATKMRTRIIRNGIELPWLAVDNHYYSDYQANRPFLESSYRKILPGDHLITECTYDTSNRPNVTIGGHPSMYEMCQTWFWHYPKSLLYCDSTANPDLNKLFGIENYTWTGEPNEEPTLTKPDAIAGMKFSNYLNTLNWTDDLKNRVQQELRYESHVSRCLGGNLAVPYPQIRQEYVEEDGCPAREDDDNSGEDDNNSGEDDSNNGEDDNNSANFVQTFSLSVFLVLLVTMLNNGW